jgi:DNA-binding transcriptional LysR family regulator
MDAGDLRVVDAVARHGSMSRAAVELNTVQSNITVRIRLLEEELGVKLFVRHSRGVLPTEAGRRLLPYAARVGQLVQEAKAAVREDGIPKGTLRLGTMECTAALRLPAVLAAYTKNYPSVSLSLTTGTSSSLVLQVLENQLDGAFVTGPIHHRDLNERAMFREELVLVSPPSVNTIQDLLKMSELRMIVFRQGCSYRRRFEVILDELGLQCQTIELASLDAIIASIAEGVGVTLLPKGIVTRACQERHVRMHELPRVQGQVDTVFIRRRDLYVTRALTAFLEMTGEIAAAQATEASL